MECLREYSSRENDLKSMDSQSFHSLCNQRTHRLAPSVHLSAGVESALEVCAVLPLWVVVLIWTFPKWASNAGGVVCLISSEDCGETISSPEFLYNPLLAIVAVQNSHTSVSLIHTPHWLKGSWYLPALPRPRVRWLLSCRCYTMFNLSVFRIFNMKSISFFVSAQLPLEPQSCGWGASDSLVFGNCQTRGEEMSLGRHTLYLSQFYWSFLVLSLWIHQHEKRCPPEIIPVCSICVQRQVQKWLLVCMSAPFLTLSTHKL